jgi:hypothetical protein
MKTPDPTEVIKAARHRLGAELDFDLHRIVEATQEREKKSGRTFIRLPKRKPDESPLSVGQELPEKDDAVREP